MKTTGITFSQRFPLALAIIFGLLLILTSLLFYRTTGTVSGVFREKVLERHHDLAAAQSSLIVDRLRQGEIPLAPEKISSAIKNITTGKPDFLYLMIFKKSPDENYFTLKKKLPLSEDLSMDLTVGKTLTDEKNRQFLKNGQTGPQVDPAIYKKGRFSWHHVYQPYTVGKKTLVLQFFINAASTETTIQSLNETIDENRRILVISTIILGLILAVLFTLFIQNYSSLMTNLSRYMQMAAEGNLDVNINNVDDDELNELARSFNTLIEEMRDLKEKEQESLSQGEDKGEEDITDDLFRQGVACLKEDKIEAAVTCFLFVAEHRTASFGSYFNLGVAYAKRKEYHESLAMFNRAAEINPHHETTSRYIERVTRLLEKNAPN